MKILLLTPQFPYPPHQGTTLRNFNLIKGLARRHRLRLFSLLAPGDAPAGTPVTDLVEHLVTAEQPRRSMARRLRDLVSTPLPDMALRLWDPRNFDTLLEHCRAHPPDVLQIEAIEMAPYLFGLLAAGVRPPRIVYDAHNAETLLQRRAFLADVRRPRRWVGAVYSAIQTLKLRRYERRLLRSVDAAAAVSEADAAELRSMAPDLPLAIVPNGVDLSAYDPRHPYPNPYGRSGPNLVFTGKMDFRPNVDAALWFADRVLPLLHASNLGPHFWIVGKSPHPRLRRLRNRPDITITGAVPDIQPYLAHADLFVAPLLAGGGTRLKILEAMAMQKPVVSTRLGADGFPVQDGVQLALADTPARFAARCLELLQHPERAAELARRGHAFVTAHYGWEKIIPGLETLYSSNDTLTGASDRR
ncbi:MAG: glycosyltransferase [Caldilineae bacterium]|nr:MAG: glycosyltransferase [Caldilineae bacterium]